jgi:hypothetical protein
MRADALKLGKPLSAVEHRIRWIAWGLVLQIVGVGIPVIVALGRGNHAGVLGTIGHITFVWHELLRSRIDVGLVVLGGVLFVLGSVILARPFVSRRRTLLVAVPIASALGVVGLGIVALLIAVVAASGSGGYENILDAFPQSYRRRRKN